MGVHYNGRVPASRGRARNAPRHTRTPSGAGGLTLLRSPEGQLPVTHADAHAVSGLELALEDPLRQGILDLLLDGALQRASAVYRVETRLPEQVARRVIECEIHVALREPLAQI